ncbi:MAG: lysylphosphatidylglycerol synthase transmembrane domain-containing protein [Polyangiaceae bacterium]
MGRHGVDLTVLEPDPSDVVPDEHRPPDPLQRFTSGGWKRGVIRLLVGVVLVVGVISYTGTEPLKRLLDPNVALFLLLGAVVHLGQRAARILKWSYMIEGTVLVQHGWRYLLRVQLIGMMGNLLLPVSEGLKVWAVSRTRVQAKIGVESIAAETALHALFVGAAGALGVAFVATAPTTLKWVSGVVVAAPLALLVVLNRWPRESATGIRVAEPRVIGWCVVETACQLFLYALALHALGVPISVTLILALSPVLFLADLIMITPSGLGMREALFAVVLPLLAGATAETGVAAGLLVSSMLLVATLAGGGLALLLPREE